MEAIQEDKQMIGRSSKSRWDVFSVVILIALLLPVAAFAGNIDSPGAPSAGSNMPTLQGICTQLDTGALAPLVGGPFAEPSAGPAPTGCSLTEIRDKAPVVDPAGATTTDVLSGKTFWGLTTGPTGQWGKQTGGMPNNGGMTINPGTADQTIPLGYHDGTGKVAGDPNLTGNNIAFGKTIFGVAGSKPRPWGCKSRTAYNGGFIGDCIGDCLTDLAQSAFCNNTCNQLSSYLIVSPPAFTAYCSR